MVDAADLKSKTGVFVATAKIRIHRARARLRKALKEECNFYRDEQDVFRCDRKSPEEPSDQAQRRNQVNNPDWPMNGSERRLEDRGEAIPQFDFEGSGPGARLTTQT